ncbi:tripartite tricarboxylate transporter substrate binding protein [Chromohalobacter sp. HP20-39]|uniref:tripartite tricarboxylate transporter substrate binding protein n=1 Tax=Chromohalobacter sp. HP20-39 TaxID=3079306 RepID=UPI00294AEBB4|nr:tripartite tricarboxylate transporter substrate binding protein [Chromohalobacter sp. HP20-39]MDV6318515.1 tripartite tricarboxylate transporter substrate binding protein [Chromohalobacter sp. HP20-39]
MTITKKRKNFLKIGSSIAMACALGSVTLASSAQAQESSWSPSQQVSMVVPFKPGGGSDIFGRAATSGIEEVRSDIDISVQNIVGGSGAVGYSTLLQRKGNPHYLLASETGAAIILPIMNDVPYSWDKLTPIAEAAEDHTMIIVANNSPYKSISDLVDAAKEGQVNIAISGKGSPASLAFKLIEKDQDVSFNRVVFESGSANNAALLGGDVAAAGANPGEAIELIKAGKVRALTIFKEERFQREPLSDVPTIAEAGIDVDVTPTLQFRGILAAPGLSEAQQTYWENAIKAWSKTEGYKNYIDNNYLTPKVRTGDEFADFLAKQHDTIAPLLKETD